MKKIIFATPFVLFFSMLNLTLDLEAAGCNSHRNKKNANTECSLTDDNCNNLKAKKISNKVDE